MACREAQGVIGGIGAQTLGVAQDVASQVSARKEDFLEFIEDYFARTVLITVDFIADYLYFPVDFGLWVGAVEDDVGQQVDGAAEVRLQHGGAVDCLLFVGEGVQFAAHALQPVGNLPGAAVFRPLEGHVFDEVCHARLGGSFVAGTHAHHVAAVHHLAVAFLVDNAQTVAQSTGMEGGFHRRNSFSWYRIWPAKASRQAVLMLSRSHCGHSRGV